jgi:hypothetical protein
MQESPESATEKVPRRFFNLSSLAALLMLITTFLCAWPEIRGMATTSLWNDELYSIAYYSAKGPLFTMTSESYIPNNHIFFNLLNSVTPGHDRFDPVRARFWSWVFVILAFLLIIVSQAWAGQLFEGSFQSFLLLANLPNLDLLLQGRGYSVLAFAAVLCGILTWHYFRKPSLLSLVGMAIAVWLGTWSVPTFMFFGAALFLTLLIYTRDPRWLVSSALAAALIALVYWPVHTSVLWWARNYTARGGGKEFATWSAIGDIFSVYLCFRASNWLTFLIVALVVVAFLLGRIASPAEKTSLCLGLAMLLAFTACLRMETPVQRTMAFTVLPFAFILTTLLTRLLRMLASPWLRHSMRFAIALLALLFALHVHKTFRFVPIEAWRETARAVEHRFPKGTEVVAQFRPQWLRIYLSADYPLTKQFDTAKFMAGKQIVVDSSFWPKDRFQIDNLPEGYALKTVPQRRGRKQTIYFWRASES